MANPFDPYYTWLGIPPEEQPPDCYRLLGIRPFEDNPEVIQNAADQRMAHLRNFQAGKHSVESQKLLNEVATARVCLLNAEKKAGYDERLRQEMETRIASEPSTDSQGPGTFSFLREVVEEPRPVPQRIVPQRAGPPRIGSLV